MASDLAVQAIGIGAGQQSRIHCTRLAGDKADKWFLRQSPKALNLPFRDDIRRPDRDNTIDVYLSDDDMDVLADGIWENFFTEKPERMTREERAEWIKNLDNVTLGSDAFIPFSDNVERANTLPITMSSGFSRSISTARPRPRYAPRGTPKSEAKRS